MFYREQRAMSNDDTMMSTYPYPYSGGVRHPPSLGLGLMTPPHTPPPEVMDLDLDNCEPLSLTLDEPVLCAAAFPHLIEAVFTYAPDASLATLRAVNRRFRERADALLLQHVVLQDNFNVALPGRGPVRANWFSLPLVESVEVLDVIDLDLTAPPLPLSQVRTLRASSIERWRAGAISTLPPSNTLVLFGRLSDRSYGPDSANWAPYIARNCTRLVAHYSSRAPELGAWGAVGTALTLSSCAVREVVFLFSGEADEADVSLLGALLMLTMQLGWHSEPPASASNASNASGTTAGWKGRGGIKQITLVNALPWFAAGIDAGESLKGDSEGDIVALFLRAAGLGRAMADDELKATYAHVFEFTTYADYAMRVGQEQFALEMKSPRRVGVKPDRWAPIRGVVLAQAVQPVEKGRITRLT